MEKKRILYDAVIVASGKGTRTGLAFNKVFYHFPNGDTVLQKAIKPFQEDEDCQKIIVVLAKAELSLQKEEGKICVCEGAKERMDSVENGLQKVTSRYVMVHDGARPYLQKEDIDRLKEALQKEEGAILALAVRDSLKYGQEGKILHGVSRENLYCAQTPQAFLSERLRQAYTQKKEGVLYTDEASLCEEIGLSVALVSGSLQNSKITYPEDLWEVEKHCD